MASSARLMPSPSSAANSDIALNPAIYALDPNSNGSVMDDLIRNMYESSESGGGGGGKTVDEVWTEIAGRKMDVGDGSGANGEITLEEYLHNEDVRVPAGFAVDPAVVGLQPGPMAVESQNHQNQVLGFGSGAESVGRGTGRKRPVLDPVDRAVMQRQKRMIKNRESAARSRERKQAYTVELESLVTQLEEENARLLKEQEELNNRRFKEPCVSMEFISSLIVRGFLKLQICCCNDKKWTMHSIPTEIIVSIMGL